MAEELGATTGTEVAASSSQQTAEPSGEQQGINIDNTKSSFETLKTSKNDLGTLEQNKPKTEGKTRDDLVKLQDYMDTWVDKNTGATVYEEDLDNYPDAGSIIDSEYGKKKETLSAAIAENVKAFNAGLRQDVSAAINARLADYSLSEDQLKMLANDVCNEHLPFINQMVQDGENIDFDALSKMLDKSIRARLDMFGIEKQAQQSVNAAKNNDFPLETRGQSGVTGEVAGASIFRAKTKAERNRAIEAIRQRIG